MSLTPDFEKIGNSAIGEELSFNECKVLADVMKAQHVADGETLICERGNEHTLFVLIEGELNVISEKDGKENVVYTMQPGEVAGTRAFVDRTPRKATLKAKGDATVYTLEPHDFESLLESQPRMLYKVMRSIFRITHRNLRRMNKETAQLENYISRSHGRY